MSVHPLPTPEPDDSILSVIANLTGVVITNFADVFGDMTVGELLEAMEDVPVRDVIKALS